MSAVLREHCASNATSCAICGAALGDQHTRDCGRNEPMESPDVLRRIKERMEKRFKREAPRDEPAEEKRESLPEFNARITDFLRTAFPEAWIENDEAEGSFRINISCDVPGCAARVVLSVDTAKISAKMQHDVTVVASIEGDTEVEEINPATGEQRTVKLDDLPPAVRLKMMSDIAKRVISTGFRHIHECHGPEGHIPSEQLQA